MNSNEFLLLVCRKFSGEITAAELKQLDLLLASDTKLAKEYKLLQQYWEQHDNLRQVLAEDGLQKVLARLNLSGTPIVMEEPLIKKRFFTPLKFTVAASVVALIAVSLLFTLQNKQKDTTVQLGSLEKKQNTKGIKSTIQLADGSKVWLNADSRIQYPKTFEGNTREIYLNGEAFFEVAKNAQKPFIIHLANGTVRVLGTSFNIRAYDNEKVVETSVATGKVAFIPKYKNEEKKQDTIFLTHDNKVTYTYTAEKIKVAATLAADDKAWTEGRMIFKAMPLQNIAVELERNFGKKVVFKDKASKEFILTGSFQDNTLEEIMFYLSQTKGFHYNITNNELQIAATAEEL